MSDSGNVKKNAAKEEKVAQFAKPGDFVRMTDETIRDKKKVKMSPRLLYAIGWPNEFKVFEVFEDKKQGLCVTLEPCCVWNDKPSMKSRATGKSLCGGHPMSCFEKLEVEKVEAPLGEDDRRASVTVPFLGELMGYEFRKGEDGQRKAVFRVGGQECVAEGALADLFNNVIQKHGIA